MGGKTNKNKKFTLIVFNQFSTFVFNYFNKGVLLFIILARSN